MQLVYLCHWHRHQGEVKKAEATGWGRWQGEMETWSETSHQNPPRVGHKMARHLHYHLHRSLDVGHPEGHGPGEAVL